MAADKTQATAVPADMGALASLMADVHTLATDARATRQKGINEVKHNTAFNPNGDEPVKLKYSAFFQNGSRANTLLMSNEEVTLVNQLKPGLYNNKKIEVVKGKNKSLHLNYATKSAAQRMDNAKYAATFAKLIENILLEQEAQAQRVKRGLPAVEDSDDDY